MFENLWQSGKVPRSGEKGNITLKKGKSVLFTRKINDHHHPLQMGLTLVMYCSWHEIVHTGFLERKQCKK